ncbi:MAG: hypothetical protein Kow00114_27240 [Kiloniellaceae bacterium]
MAARFRCLGGIDVDPAACRDFERLAGAPATALDLFDRGQYAAFHGCEPDADWREATAADVQRAFGWERPHIVFLSAPCKGFSGLLSQKASETAKYQALNRLTLRGVWLMLEAYRDDPPELVIFENVPRIMTRGRALLDRIVALLRGYGYAVAETTHDCGEIGGLAQSRKRFLLVARHAAKVPPFLYEPEKRPLRGVGAVLEKLPVPGPEALLPMHRLPALQWKTWVRLAFVEAGSDWRSLNRLAVEDGVLRDFALVPEAAIHDGAYGVKAWSEPGGTVTSSGRPASGAFSVADPRCPGGSDYGSYGVGTWDAPAATLTSQRSPGQGRFSVADPRLEGQRFNHAYRIVPWDAAAPAVAGPGGPAGGLSVADPRPGRPSDQLHGKHYVTPWPGASRAVIGGSDNGAFVVADPRPGFLRGAPREGYATQGHYGVLPWQATAGAIPAYAKHDRGRWAVADPRPAEAGAAEALPAGNDRLVAVIRALDGTWHRPFTTLELAALQSLVDPEEVLELDGLSDSAWRERIGNAVPPDAATAIAGVMGRTLLLAWSGETFTLSSAPIWVRPVAVALAVDAGAEEPA